MKGSKGISLSIETVVLVILAAVVIAVLLAFLWGAVNPAKNEVDLLRVQNEACSEISQVDLRCGLPDVDSNDIRGIVNEKLLKGNPAPCNPNRPSCTPNRGLSQNLDPVASCIQTCCKIFCS
ncbi:MAG: hypothetical protein HYW25_05235 [Candidatus Aenigmarchaeota archaeon]|nr:hypothetical protein [Candidatus Aenigmarchaeota archaeon]